MKAVLYETHEGWAEIILNRPDRRNAIEGTLAQELGDTLRAVAADGSIRAIVLRGAGGAFCSGLDLKAFAEQPEPTWKAGFGGCWDEVHSLLLESQKVVITALERYAINAGAALALAGDLMICGEGAYLQVGEIQVGMAAPRNLAWLALRHSEAVAARLCLLGDRVPAGELLRLGIATEIQADAHVVDRAQELAKRIAAYPPSGVAAVKSGLRAAFTRMPTDQWMAACAAHNAMAGQASVPPPPSKRRS